MKKLWAQMIQSFDSIFSYTTIVNISQVTNQKFLGERNELCAHQGRRTY